MAAYAKQTVSPIPRMTPQEYMEYEGQTEVRNEYYDGVIVAMTGDSPEHNKITFNLIAELGPQIKGSDCTGFSSDMRVSVPACNKYFYPDGLITCGEPLYEELAGLRSLRNPTLIIEVLSESTEAKDRGEKFICYQTLESLSIYVLVTQYRPQIEVYTRQADGSWRYEVLQGMESVLTLPAIGCELRFVDVYARVEFPAPPPADA